MSRRETDRYDDRQTDYYRRGGRTEREDVDYRATRYEYEGQGPSRRNETVVKERESDTVISQGRRGPRQPDFLREDYGRNDNAGQLVIREETRDEDEYVGRRGGGRSRANTQNERVEREEVIRRERSRGPPGPKHERDDLVFRDRPRPRRDEEIDIRIKEKEVDRGPPRHRNDEEVVFQEDRTRSRNLAPRREVVDKEEITIRERSRSRIPPPPRAEFVEEEDIHIRERSRAPPPRRGNTEEKINIDIKETERSRGEVTKEKIDIDIRETERSDRPPPLRHRSSSRGALVRKDREEWVVRKRRTPSPSPSPPPRDYEKEEIVIRRRERSLSPEPLPSPPPPPEPAIFRPPIIQEVITHHRTIDHGVERIPDPLPPPPPPAPVQEDEDIDISIRRKGVRNGRPFDENINIDIDSKERDRAVSNREVVSSTTTDLRRSASTSGRGRRYESETISAEADYYNNRITSRGYPGEAYNGATRDWGLADIPPGTERVAMDGIGGARQELTWGRYNGDRQGQFIAGGRVYEGGYGGGGGARDDFRETRVTETRIEKETSRGSNRDRKWTEISKDLVIEEAIKERGYEYQESEGYFYVMEYLQYVSARRVLDKHLD